MSNREVCVERESERAVEKERVSKRLEVCEREIRSKTVRKTRERQKGGGARSQEREERGRSL